MSINIKKIYVSNNKYKNIFDIKRRKIRNGWCNEKKGKIIQK